MFNKFKKILIYGLVSALLLQGSFALSLINPQKAMAASANITQINFTTALQSINQNTASVKMTVQTQNVSGLPETVSESTTLTLSSDSSTGLFSLNGTSTWASTKNTTFSSGSTKDFYYKDSTPGTYTITVSAEGKNWTVATQTITITTPDTTAPVITLVGANPQIIELGSTYQELGATATDEIDGNISANIIINSSNVNTSVAGTYQVTYDVSDVAENHIQKIRTVNVVDTTTPIGTISINGSATVTDEQNVNLTLTTDDAILMQFSNDNITWSELEAFNTTKVWPLTSGNELKTVYVRFQDQAGNISQTYTAQITLDSNTAEIVTNNIIVGDNKIFPIPTLELDITGLANAVLTTASYNSNPGVNLPTGITAFGKYFEIALNDKNLVTWPITIKLYYTQNDLDQVKIDESKLVGLYYYDQVTNAWKLFENTGVDTNDIIVNGVQYAGYLWTNTNHLTPVTAGYDITAPTKPANFTAKAKDGEINLTWEKVTDARGYYVRYREGTSIDNKAYQTIFLTGADSTSTKATGLKNGVLYEFGIKSVDNFNNESEWAVVVATPVTEAILASAQTTVLKSTTETTPSTNVDQGKSAEIKNVTPEEGTVKSDNEMKTSTRFWITLLILVIAAGAAYGGYYAYQWWMAKPKKEKIKVKKVTPPPTPKNPEKGGRW
jgi:hypothetical protein